MKYHHGKPGYRAVTIILILLLSLASLPYTAAAQSPAVSPSTSGQPAGPAITSIKLSVNPPASPPASPAAGITYADVEVSIQVANFNLVEKSGEPNVPGEGHIIYYLAEPPTFPKAKAHAAQGLFSEGTVSTSHTWSNYNYTAGEYWIFSAQLVNNDDTPLVPPVFARIVTHLPAPGENSTTRPAIISFSLSTALPAGPPLSPASGLTFMDTTVDLEFSGLELTSWIGNILPANVPGQGHLMYYWFVEPLTVPGWYAFVDNFYSYYRAVRPFVFANSAAGYNSFSVQLVNNDNTPLEPPVYATIRTHLQPGMGTPPAAPPVAAAASAPSPTMLPPAIAPTFSIGAAP